LPCHIEPSICPFQVDRSLLATSKSLQQSASFSIFRFYQRYSKAIRAPEHYSASAGYTD
jgi:hypothetical protein